MHKECMCMCVGMGAGAREMGIIAIRILREDHRIPSKVKKGHKVFLEMCITAIYFMVLPF